MPKIDLHTHILPPPDRWPDLSTRYGYAGWIALDAVEAHAAGADARARMVRVEADRTRTFFREVRANVWDPSVRLAEMDAHGVDAQVLSTVPVMFSYWARPQDTLDVSRWLNDHLAAVVSEHPYRFAALGTIPLNAPALATKELERCVRDLGMAGVQIGTNVNGMDLGDPSLRGVFAAAEELDACVFVHPWDMLRGCEAPSAPASNTGAHEPPAPHPIAPRMRENWMAWLVGMPAETALAVCSVLFSGLLERFPRLRIGFAHGAGCFPGCIGRIDRGFHARADLCQSHTTTPPRSHLAHADESGRRRPARFYADSLTHDPELLAQLIRLLGSERVALGSDYPFPLGEDRPGAMIESMTELTSSERDDLNFRTAIEFLGPRANRLRGYPAGPG